jgi:hypothetical protein
MKVEKMSLANAKGKLSRTEMKMTMAGSGGGGCKTEYEYDCSTELPCCPGLSCEDNASNDGTICMNR